MRPAGCDTKTTLPYGIVSAKWRDRLGDVVSDAVTMRIVYAGPQILEGPALERGENIWRPER
jgi:hypothetical protein